MHDLNTINVLNEAAFAEGINNLRRQGRTVVALYEGMHLIGYESFSDPVEAAAVAAKIPETVGQRYTLFAPHQFTQPNGTTRDQSEDRAANPVLRNADTVIGTTRAAG